ncbi:hypothetical protein COU59_03730 [Candidatus Pacearchaeota archaeon CG10_big_fil_rev_8_21_14_0_10_34_12]|nr:MAG: hypothetical protein COU59_03730 [Candidatus Pacearchaeota archaeon CG10_big_fil_rev_8_21_14_0_10_34_12]
MEGKTINWLKVFGFFSPLALMFLFNFIFLFVGIYAIFENLGILMHLLGGSLVGYSIFLTLTYFEKLNIVSLDRFSKLTFIVSFVALIAVFWEFFEFSLTYLTGFSFQGTLADTMSDLLLGILGGFTLGIFLILFEKGSFN